MKNSADSPRSESVWREVALAALALSVLVGAFAVWLFTRGYLLYYGDAQAHLNISRSLLDSRTPGYDQLGTVWLPVLHVLCLPFAASAYLWTTGLAGTLPVAACFVIAGVFLYQTACIVYATRKAAIVVLACFALNPNILYLASIPMTEIVFAAELSALVWCYVRYRQDKHEKHFVAAIGAVWLLCLTRYDGWFVIPFAALWFASALRVHRIRRASVFAAFASAAPMAWLLHNWYLTGNPLDFFNGPYSAKAIQGSRPYPGLHNWPLAAFQYSAAGVLCCGWPLLLLGIAGAVVAFRQKRFAVIALLCVTPLFYVWSIHSSGTPIFVPGLYPFGYYNTRYGLALALPAAFAVGALAARGRSKAWMIPCLAIAPWLLYPHPSNWICWRESEINSTARRVWTSRAAAFLQTHYAQGEGILTTFGDVTGVFCKADIPLRETVHVGNGAQWLTSIVRPELSPQPAWAVAQHGDELSRAVARDPLATYTLTYGIEVHGAPPLEIYRRSLPLGGAN